MKREIRGHPYLFKSAQHARQRRGTRWSLPCLPNPPESLDIAPSRPQLPKLRVASSNLVARSNRKPLQSQGLSSFWAGTIPRVLLKNLTS